MSVGLILIMILIGASIFVNGWTDAPNAITTVISTRVLSPRRAIILAAVFNFLGVMAMGTAVANTISGIIELQPGPEALIIIGAAQVAIVSWALGAWRFGIPTSESHALVAGLTGAALASGGLSSINWAAWEKVLIGLGISTILGFVSAYVVTLGVGKAFGNVKRAKANKIFSVGQVVSASAMAFSHGAQDGQKFMGVLAMALVYGGVTTQDQVFADGNVLLLMMIFCSVLISVGTSIGGMRIIKTMGMDMVRLEKYQGFSSEVAASACMIGSTVLGIPLSTTNTKGAALMGAAAARRVSSVNWGIVKEMILAWILTFPGCALIGFVMALIFQLIF
ncbi:MAG: inorganic phosphate transporter [Christensenellales bacterium]|jgi:PiT family inorganic phosphate transporter